LVEDDEREGKGKPEGLKTKVEAGKAQAKPPSVQIYSTPDCPYCAMAKEYLSGRKVRYTDIDVASDREKAKEMVAVSGQGGVPVLIINGRVIIGFDRPLIDDALTRPPPARRDTLVRNLSFDIFDRR
jgi:glutaredoxin 3